MSKYLVKLGAVISPFLILLCLLEYQLATVDTHYRTKSSAVKSDAKKIEVLVMGSSNAYYNINPQYFSLNGYSLAFNAQSMYYDDKLIEKYLGSFENLKLVIFPAIYFTMGTTLINSSQSWRQNFYSSYFHIRPESEENNSFFLMTQFVHPEYYSKTALYGSEVPSIIKSNFTSKIDYVPTQFGWYDSKDLDKASITSNIGETAANSHNLEVNVALFQRNLDYWKHASELLTRKKVKVVLIRMPADKSYYEHLDPIKFRMMRESLERFAKQEGVSFYDYAGDTRFSTEDFTFMVDHMNPIGAEKFTRILDNDFVRKIGSLP